VQNAPGVVGTNMCSGRDGKWGIMHCSQAVAQTWWNIHGYEFNFDLKVLPPAFLCMVLVLDWLETFSPMKVHWKHRWMLIPYGGT
jgi:hypothetical protein